MGRADELRARYAEELAVIELEDELSLAKETVERCGECGRRTAVDPPELREVKERLRAARQAFRAQREGGAVVSPEAIEVTTSVPVAGGAE